MAAMCCFGMMGANAADSLTMADFNHSIKLQVAGYTGTETLQNFPVLVRVSETRIPGFRFADMTGSEANDRYTMFHKKVATITNHNGGINGGITNGMPVVFRCAVKPTPSIALPQDSVDADGTREETLTLGGRHDPAVVHRARAVVDSAAALVLCDALAMRYGTDWLNGETV